MKQMKLVPKRRFKEFKDADAWEQRKLGEVFVSLQNNTLSRAELSTKGGIARDVHYGDVLIRFGEYLDVKKEVLPIITDELIAQKYKASFLKNGDIVVADTAEDDTVGKCSEIAGLSDEVIISGLHTIPYRPLFNFANGYLGYYMNSSAYHRQLFPLMQGIKVTSISKSAMQNTIICYPKSEQEQYDISKYFRRLDNLITLHQRKCEKLKSIKSAYLTEMFPQKNETVPKRRFAGFTDAWEQRKLGDMTSVLSASRVHREEWRNSGVPFYRSSDVVSAYKGMENERVYISYELFEKLSSVSGKPQKGDIFITGGGSIGIPYIVPDNNPLYSKDADLIWVKRTDQIDPYCLYTYFLSPTFRNYLTGISHIGTIAHYTIEQVKNTAPLLPIVIEQKKIGDFFKSLDNLITLHQRKLKKLQDLKAAYLQDMFV
jgi:type I restriction enzyme S subunit